MEYIDTRGTNKQQEEIQLKEPLSFSRPLARPPSISGCTEYKDRDSIQSSSFTSESSSVLSSSSTLIDDKSSNSSLASPALSANYKRNSTEVLPEKILIHASTFPSASEPSYSTCTPSPLSASHRSSLSFSRSRSRSIAMKSNSLPAIPTICPKDLRFPKHKDCSFISPADLHHYIENMDQNPNEKLIIFDTRPFIEFNKNHIRSAMHLCLPSTLLKRKNFNLERLIGNLPSPGRETLSEYLLGSDSATANAKVVIYDNVANQTDYAVSLACFGISSKILDHVSDKQKPSVFILAEGFESFNAAYPDDVEVGTMDLEDSYTLDSPSSPHQADNISPVQPQLKHSGRSHSHSCSPLKQPPQTGNSRTLSGSPISTSSPLSSLFGFKLPAPINNQHLPTFKLPQIEHDISDLDNYVKAVEINERSQRNSFLESENDLRSFKFPASPSKQFSTDATSSSFTSTQTALSPADPSSGHNSSKLNFQVKYDNLYHRFASEEINQVVPSWFCQLMDIPKLHFISKFQRLELLERKRLQRLLGPSSSASIVSTQSRSTVAGNDRCVEDGHYDVDEDDAEENLQSITISSGVEFGTKNRYKDIFPYEHTRVKLSHSSICSAGCENSTPSPRSSAYSSCASGLPTQDEQEDVWNTYINANYLVNPFAQLQQSSTADIKSVRYIATQAPLKETISDFYTCILNNNVPIILTLTDEFENGVEKCCNFWANGNYDGINVKLLDEFSTMLQDKPMKAESNHEEDMFASKFWRHLKLNKTSDNNNEIIIRRIELSYNNDRSKFQLLQLQIKDWPDLGTLLKPNEILQIINLKNFVIDSLFAHNVYSPNYTPTVLVHCSAGCGRTGTLCTVDSILSNLKKFDTDENPSLYGAFAVPLTPNLSPTTKSNSFSATKPPTSLMFDPIVTTVNQFRRQRISMVQNINQFLFIYDCLLFYFTLNLETSPTDPEKRNNWQSMTDENSHLDILHKFIDGKVNELQQV